MKILYVDDEQSALDKFMKEHAVDGFSVEGCQDALRLTEKLNNYKKKDLPDLIVMDLYRTKSDLNTNSAAETNKKVDELVSRIGKIRKELEILVRNEKDPVGIDVLESLHQSKKLKHIPVIINTREGLNLLSDNLFRKLVKLGADWMIKGREPNVIRELINRKFEESQQSKKRIERDLFLMILGSVIGALLGYVLSIIGT